MADVSAPGARLGKRVDVAGGAYYFAWVSMEEENTLFTQVRANWDRLDSAWSIRAWFLRRELRDEWERLAGLQKELLSRARSFDAAWRGLRIEARADEFKQGWSALEGRFRLWEVEAAGYGSRCAGTSVDPVGCMAVYRRLTAELADLQAQEAALKADWEGIAKAHNLHYDSTVDYSREVEKWQRDLIAFNQRLQSESRSAKPGRWSCKASCNVQQIRAEVECPARTAGFATGPSEELACREAKRVATQSTPEGCYPRHCQCDCSE